MCVQTDTGITISDLLKTGYYSTVKNVASHSKAFSEDVLFAWKQIAGDHKAALHRTPSPPLFSQHSAY